MSELGEVGELSDTEQLPEHGDVDEPSRRGGHRSASEGGGSENSLVDLARIAWLTVVLACVIAVLILVLNGYYGYAAVTVAVAASAAINLK